MAHKLSNDVDTSRISPRFPSYEEARERLHQRRETLVARGFLILLAISPIIWYFNGSLRGVLAAGIGGLGFVLTCFYAGNRQYERMQSHKLEV